MGKARMSFSRISDTFSPFLSNRSNFTFGSCFVKSSIRFPSCSCWRFCGIGRRAIFKFLVDTYCSKDPVPVNAIHLVEFVLPWLIAIARAAKWPAASPFVKVSSICCFARSMPSILIPPSVLFRNLCRYLLRMSEDDAISGCVDSYSSSFFEYFSAESIFGCTSPVIADRSSSFSFSRPSILPPSLTFNRFAISSIIPTCGSIGVVVFIFSCLGEKSFVFFFSLLSLTVRVKRWKSKAMQRTFKFLDVSIDRAALLVAAEGMPPISSIRLMDMKKGRLALMMRNVGWYWQAFTEDDKITAVTLL
mmetsp:Transcript_8979/g.13800  ORF Transcript_8979/g.13800 Transcript_8979/m.13800 type:complete len:304 (-) Transcript_8979:44-955(-)